MLSNAQLIQRCLHGDAQAWEGLVDRYARLVYSIPALGNQVVLLLKDTSLLSAIAVAELTMQAKVLTERTAAAYQAFLVAALLYLVLVSASEAAFRTAHRAVRWR